MNIGIKVALIAAASFVAGFGAGYFTRKKSETPFEIVTDEEQLAFAEEDMAKQKKSVEDQIVEAFDGERHAPVENEEGEVAKAINTQKTEYWKKASKEYDKHSPLPEGEEPVVSEEGFDETFLSEAEAEAESEGNVKEDIPTIEESTIQEFYHWNAVPDGEYSAETLYWYAGDDAVIDEDDNRVANPDGYLGFNIKSMFEGKNLDQADPEPIYIKNNETKMVFEIVRYNSTYSVLSRMGGSGVDEGNNE